MKLKGHGKNVTNDYLDDLASRIVLHGNIRDFTSNPLSPGEITEVMEYCRLQLCDGDLGDDYKAFYAQAFNLLKDELDKIIN